jgi:TPR repeat protein
MRPKPGLLIAILAFTASTAVAADSYQEGKLAYERGEYAKAEAKLHTAAQKGNQQAQELLGFMYAFGPQVYPGVRQDFRMAVTWLAKATGDDRPTARYMYCAVVRREAAGQLGRLHCFDDFADSSDSASDWHAD